MRILLGNVVRIQLLLLVQGLKVGFDGEGHDGWGVVGEVLLKGFGIHFEVLLGFIRWKSDG